MVSLNTNISAINAQQSLNTASLSTTASSSRLSSGNRIDTAKTDVAGLAVGTILATNVSTLRQGLQNAGQANSLLQIADGGLQNITNILQRQKALAAQAASGSLTDTQRAFLDQEFQNLTQQIDSTVGNTTFSSLSLLDGSLSAQASQATSTKDKGSAGTVVSTGTAATIAVNAAAGDTITVAGVTFTFIAATATPNPNNNQIVIGSSVIATASNVVHALNASGDSRLQNFYFTNTAGTSANIVAEWGGGKIDAAATTGVLLATSASNTTNITNTGNKNVAASAANAVDGNGLDRTFAIGLVGTAGGILRYGGTTVSSIEGAPIDLSAVDRTSAFTGALGGANIGKFQATYISADSVRLTLQVGNITYGATIADTTPAAGAAVALVGQDANGVATGGTVTLNLAVQAVAGVVNSQADANNYANLINNAFAGVTFVQNRDITSVAQGGTAYVSGVPVSNLTNISANFRSDDFSTVNIGNFKITAPGTGQNDATFSVSINGEQYVSYSGIGSKIATNSIISFRNVNNPNRSFSLVTGGWDNTTTTRAAQQGTALDVSTQANADATAAQLNLAFGVQSGNAILQFQVGSTSAQSIGVQIGSAKSSALFSGQTLSIATSTSAAAASTAIDTAINTVTALRATVGALESRFTYASTQLNTSITNLDAARGAFLDTDVSTESTAYATSQVKLQASISVLAQANQLPQNLLKLLA